MPRKSLRARLGAFQGLRQYRDPDIAAKIDGQTGSTEPLSEHSGLQSPSEHTVPAEADASITHNGSIWADIGLEIHQEKQETPAHFDNETLLSGTYDSGYGGSETLAEPPKWSNPQLSTGRLILTAVGHNIWEAKGPAVERFEEMKPVINDFLKAHTRTISHPLYSVFMTGRIADKARPTIIFYCRNIDRGKDSAFIRDAFKKSRILDSYPGFKTGHSSRPKEYSVLFPQQDFYCSQALSTDGKSTIRTSSLASSGDKTISESCSFPDNVLQIQCDANPPSGEVHQAEHTLEQTSIPGPDLSGEPSSSPDETHHMSEEIVPSFTRLTKWVTDRIWPTPDGLQRIWYLCVSLSLVLQSKSD